MEKLLVENIEDEKEIVQNQEQTAVVEQSDSDLIIRENMALISQDIQTVIEQKQALHEELARPIDSKEVPAPSIEAMQTAVNEFESLMSKDNLSRDEENRQLMLFHQIEQIPNLLRKRSRELKNDFTLEEQKQIALQYRLYGIEDEVRLAQTEVDDYKKTFFLFKYFDKEKRSSFERAKVACQPYYEVQQQIKQVEQRITTLQDERSEVNKKIRSLTDISTPIFWTDFLAQIEQSRIKEVIVSAKAKVEQEVQLVVSNVRQKLFEQYIKDVVIPEVETKLIYDKVNVITEDELQGLLIENTRKEYIDFFIRSSSNREVSPEECELLGIEPVTKLEFGCDTVNKTFYLLNLDREVQKTLHENEIQDFFFITAKHEPGAEFSKGVTVKSWSASERKLVLTKEDGQEIVIQSGEDYSKFFASEYGIQQDDEGNSIIRIDERDPYIEHLSHHKGQVWKVGNRQNGQVALSQQEGIYSVEARDQLIKGLTDLVRAKPDQREGIINLLYRDLDCEGNYNLSRDVESYCNFDPDEFIRLLAFSPLQEKVKKNEIDDILTLSYVWYEIDFGEKVSSLYRDSSTDFEYLINSPLIKNLFPLELESLLDIALQEARAELKENNSPGYNGISSGSYKLAFNYGNTEDFYTIFLNTILEENSDVTLLSEFYKKYPDAFKVKVDEMRSILPRADKILEVLVLTENQDNKRLYIDGKKRLRREMAESIKERIINEDTPPEEKFRLLQIMVGQNEFSKNNLNLIFNQEDSDEPEFIRAVMLYLRTFPGIEDKVSPSEISSEMIEAFTADFKQLIQGLSNGNYNTLEPIVSLNGVLGFLARHPESLKQILQLPVQAPDFLEMISTGSELESNKDQLIHYLFADGDIVSRAKSMVSIFVGNEPLYEKLIAFVDTRLKQMLERADSLYPIKIVVNGKEKELPFKELSYEQKRQVLYERVKRSIVLSRSSEAKIQASRRNQDSPDQFLFKPGMYLHGLPATVLGSLLRNGNMCGEVLGPTAKTDSYPFQVDYSYLLSSDNLDGQSLSQVISDKQCASFGTDRLENGNGQVIAVTDRNRSEWEKGITYFAQDYESNHTLILGASPSTEVHYFLLTDPAVSLPYLVKACVEEEHYIPAYALETKDGFEEGKRVFSYEDYLKAIEEKKSFLNSRQFLDSADYLDSYDVEQTSGAHKFTLKNHLLLATEKAQENGQNYNLTQDEQVVVNLAARLHDIGKGATGAQLIDNPVVAASFLSQIRGLSTDNKELILNLIRYDELLGDIVQGRKRPDQFSRIFPNERHQRMLLSLYKADVQAIDGDTDENSLYHVWQVADKLKKLELERA